MPRTTVELLKCLYDKGIQAVLCVRTMVSVKARGVIENVMAVALNWARIGHSV